MFQRRSPGRHRGPRGCKKYTHKGSRNTQYLPAIIMYFVFSFLPFPCDDDTVFLHRILTGDGSGGPPPSPDLPDFHVIIVALFVVLVE